MKKLPLISVSMLLAVTGWAATNLPPMTANELLDKLAAARELPKSFIAVFSYSGINEGGRAAARGELGGTNEVRVNGSLVAARSWIWQPLTAARANPYYLSMLTDGRTSLEYSTKRNSAMLGPILPGRTSESVAYENAQSLKFCLGDLGVGWLDLKLRQEPSLRVREKPELAGWVPSPCYVLEAQTAVGHFTVWLDPARGYRIAKAINQYGFGNTRLNGMTFPPGESHQLALEKVRWEQRGGVWIPVEGTVRREEKSPFTDWAWAHRVSQFRLARFVLNPDHDRLRSFVPDDIPDGVRVILLSEDPTLSHARRGSWQRGRVVDAAGNVLWTPESLGGADTNRSPQSGGTGGAHKPTTTSKK